MQEWELQLKQPIGNDCPISCPEYLSRKTGPTLVGVVNGSSENSKMLQLLHHPKRDGDCIAIYPLPQNRYYYDEDGPHGTFIPGSILEIDIVSSDNIVVIHLGKPRALPTIKNWDVWPSGDVLGGLIGPQSGERFITTLVYQMDLKFRSTLLGQSRTVI